jgi:hypothetical protein
VKQLIFKQNDFISFRKWIRLNLEEVTWQGKYINEFEEFWDYFFYDGLNFPGVLERFSYANKKIKIGPLASWFKWLKHKFICYVFIFHDKTIKEISHEGEIKAGDVATVLRDFFIEINPHQDDYLNSIFMLSDVTSASNSLSYKDLKLDQVLQDTIPGTHEDEVLASLEVTLYDEWIKFVDDLKRDVGDTELTKIAKSTKNSYLGFLKMLRESIALVVVGALLMIITSKLNRWYENYLADKISVYEPTFLLLDRNLTFREKKDSIINVDTKKIEDIELKEVTENQELPEDERRYETESDAELTSVDSISSDFTRNNNPTVYEEKNIDGYRETARGDRDVYRLLLNSANAEKIKLALDTLLKRYEASKVDRVEPGTKVPGGIYYNLYVNKTYLKEFLSQIVETHSATLYRGSSKIPNPAGKSKVFIWVKTI